jgi:hypothetical protein
MTKPWKNIYFSLNISFRYERVLKCFQTGRLKQEMQTVQLSATRYSCFVILWVSLVSFATITLCVASWVFIVVSIYFIIDSVWKLLYTPLHIQSTLFQSTNILILYGQIFLLQAPSQIVQAFKQKTQTLLLSSQTYRDFACLWKQHYK